MSAADTVAALITHIRFQHPDPIPWTDDICRCCGEEWPCSAIQAVMELEDSEQIWRAKIAGEIEAAGAKCPDGLDELQFDAYMHAAGIARGGTS